MKEQVKIRVRIGSDPHCLMQIIQDMSDEEVEAYLQEQAMIIAQSDAVKSESGIVMSGDHLSMLRHRHRIQRMAEEMYIRRHKQLSKYKIRIKRINQIPGKPNHIEIVGERI